MYYTYILQNPTGKLYIGSSENLKTRLSTHNAGKVQSTKYYRPWKMIYYEAYTNKTLARKTEIFYKTSQGRRQIKKKLQFD